MIDAILLASTMALSAIDGDAGKNGPTLLARVYACHDRAAQGKRIEAFYSQRPYTDEKLLGAFMPRSGIAEVSARLQPGHYYIRFSQGGCNRVLGVQVFERRRTSVSLALRAGAGLVLDAYDISLAGTVPSMPLPKIYLVTADDVIRYPIIRTSDTYDFEFIRPAAYYLDVRLTDGSVCQVPINLRHLATAHRRLDFSERFLLDCIKRTPQSGL